MADYQKMYEILSLQLMETIETLEDELANLSMAMLQCRQILAVTADDDELEAFNRGRRTMSPLYDPFSLYGPVKKYNLEQDAQEEQP